MLVETHWRWWFCSHGAMTWDFQQCGMCDQQSLRSACAYTQSDQSLCLSFEFSMTVKLLTEHLSLKGGCTCWSESTLVKMSNCWKSHAAAHLIWTRGLVQIRQWQSCDAYGICEQLRIRRVCIYSTQTRLSVHCPYVQRTDEGSDLSLTSSPSGYVSLGVY